VNSVKIAQSLGSKTSINFKYLNRMNVGLVSGLATVMNSDNLFTEEELFDDRYGYNGHEFYLSIIRFLPAYIKLELNSGYLWKNYENRQIYDLDGNVIESGDNRLDKRSFMWLRLSRGFNVNWGIKNIQVNLDGGYLNNLSNDVYYKFDNYFTSLGLEFSIR